MHPQIRTVALGEFSNPTEFARLGPLLRSRLAEHFTTDGSLRVTDRAQADAFVRGDILRVTTRQIASSKARDSSARVDERDAYQAAMFRAEVEVRFELVMPHRKHPVLGKRTVLGEADFSRLPDLIIARNEGFEQAVNDAAGRIVEAVTEAW